ncbi:unnamed protein product [Didymodactylos carnosus]|uniref:NAD(P)(+)--arginine ADP-ribosyltransferase n=1 Tax=Didymodactylos carnosus TaxID=1234261 RepID=A0A814VLA9_9BILA|nr:unnamed protein product [Didymodactylos carnosus]CAF1440120.1 unnamed protein product [Didymodactylos carnosus]CAF3954753.1 unnamed protein product [Didymodactylos carnosus]CAF4236551.1 unnamed protein product [Didymodactylos carnosus]
MNRFTEFQLEDTKLTPIAGYWAYQLVSIDEALRSFMSEINELKRSVKEAKKYCTYPSEHKLTRDESAALFLYTMEAGEHSFYRILNQILRNEDRNQVKPWFSYLKLFDTALHKLPKVKGNVWRAVPGNVTSSYKTDRILNWWSISSCSTSVDVVKAFLKPDQEATLFMIEAADGRNLAGYTMYPNEKEVILGVGTQLRVKNIGFKHGNLHVVHLEEIKDDNTDDDDDQEEVAAAISKIHVTPNSPKLNMKTTSSKSV